MLAKLCIKNIALINQLEINFTPGLIVITGETGAGKSIILDALSLVLGERADRELIKSNAEKASVEAVFETLNNVTLKKLETLGIEIEDSQIILSRELTIGGKNTCRINGRLASLSLLKAASDALVDIHAQNQSYSLLDESTQIAFLDSYGKQEIEKLKNIVAQDYKKVVELKSKIKKNYSPEQIERKIDTLTRQIEEISNASLQDAFEEQELKKQQLVLQNAETIMNSLSTTCELVNGDSEFLSALQQIKNACSALEQIKEISPQYEESYKKISDIYYSLEDLDFEVRKLREEVVFDEYQQEEIEKRLDIIDSLKRKYGSDINAINGFAKKALDELDELEQNKILAQKSDIIMLELQTILFNNSLKLSEARKKAAAKLEIALLKELSQLGLEKSNFKLDFAPLKDFQTICDNFEFSANGIDNVEMLLSTNPGEPLKALRKVASGGEISRIMLSLKSVAAEQFGCSCLVFDEIDTGISGRVAFVVGEKLMKLSKKHQVICITHSPQIAAMGDSQFLIIKTQDNKNTTTGVEKLTQEGRITEISRILGSDESTIHGVEYAKDLMLKAQIARKKL